MVSRLVLSIAGQQQLIRRLSTYRNHPITIDSELIEGHLGSIGDQPSGQLLRQPPGVLEIKARDLSLR